jgi:LmbE family N-acetylglucosaminyl deacetylase
MAVLAHPDDESLGFGGTLAKYSAEGVATYVVTATRGERGRYGDAPVSPGPAIVAPAREAELRCAARELGVRDVSFLGYHDGDLDRASPAEAIERIAAHVRAVQPQVVMTFGPDGAYGHPDHIAICQFTTAALVRAADAYQVPKLYYLANSEQRWSNYQTALRTLSSTVDGTVRFAVAWPEWEITTIVDATPVWETVRRAVQCHKTQMSIYKKFETLSQAEQRTLWGRQEFYRAYSMVNGGRTQETDLFEGVR